MCMQTQSENINELAAALSKAQGSVLKAKEDKRNPFYKSKYADLGSVWDSCRKALSENGFAVIQTIDEKKEKMILVTTLVHTSGQWIKSFAPINNIKQDPQSIGSAITYMRRYSLAAIVGVSTSDDDGEAATRTYREKQSKINELKDILQADLELKKNVDNYITDSKYNSIEDLPQKVIDNIISKSKKPSFKKVLRYKEA